MTISIGERIAENKAELAKLEARLKLKKAQSHGEDDNEEIGSLERQIRERRAVVANLEARE